MIMATRALNNYKSNWWNRVDLRKVGLVGGGLQGQGKA